MRSPPEVTLPGVVRTVVLDADHPLPALRKVGVDRLVGVDVVRRLLRLLRPVRLRDDREDQEDRRECEADPPDLGEVPPALGLRPCPQHEEHGETEECSEHRTNFRPRTGPQNQHSYLYYRIYFVVFEASM